MPGTPVATALALLIAVAPGNAQQVTAFVDVTVLPMDREAVLPGHTVVVRGDRIEAVGPAGTVAVPAGAVRIEGRGKFLMPGLAEMHAHIPGANAPQQVQEDVLVLYVANGITTIRGMLGAPNQLVLRERAGKQEIVAPWMLLGGPSLNGNSAPTPQAAMALVEQNIAAGYDLQKVHPGPSRVTYDSAVAVATRRGFRLAGHVPAAVGLQRALEVKEDIDHLDGYLEAAQPPLMRARIESPTDQVPLGEVFRSVDPSQIPSLVQATVRSGIYQAPTMYLWENLFGSINVDSLAALPEMRYVPRQWVQNWRNQKAQRLQGDAQNGVTESDRQRLIAFRRSLLKALADGGAHLLMGTDAPQMFNVPGFSLHHELLLMRTAGLTNYQVLQSGTANVGRYVREKLGRQERFGVVSQGQRADLLLLDANPLADLSHLARRSGVMVRGRWITAGELQRSLDDMAARNAQ